MHAKDGPDRARSSRSLRAHHSLEKVPELRKNSALKKFGTGTVPSGLLMRRQGTDEPILKRIFLSFAAVISVVSCAHAESGLASYYGGRGHSGEMTCAHRTRAMGTMVTVTYRGRSIRCRVNDRGPFIKGRVIDVSISAARALGMMDAGVVMVSLGVD
jgi:rare lipoprotein A